LTHNDELEIDFPKAPKELEYRGLEAFMETELKAQYKRP